MSVHHKDSEQEIKAHVTYSCVIIHANTQSVSETI